MKDYSCPKCGSINVFIDERPMQTALMCNDCGSWLKWISKKELPLVKRFIEEMKKECEDVAEQKSSDDIYDRLETLKGRIQFTGNKFLNSDLAIELISLMQEIIDEE